MKRLLTITLLTIGLLEISSCSKSSDEAIIIVDPPMDNLIYRKIEYSGVASQPV